MKNFWAALLVAAFLAGCASHERAQRPLVFSAPEPARVIGATHIKDLSAVTTPPVALAVTIDTSRVERATPGIRRWAEQAAALCQQWYPLLCAELASDGFTPRDNITLAFVPRHVAPAFFRRGRITINVEHLSQDPSNYGMVIHELAHAAQGYPEGMSVVWLMEGIADYVRFYLYEADPDRGWIQPGQSKYNDSYRTTACFLDYLVRTYDRELVRKLNAALRRRGVTEEEVVRLIVESAAAKGSPRKNITDLFDEFISVWSRESAAPPGR